MGLIGPMNCEINLVADLKSGGIIVA